MSDESMTKEEQEKAKYIDSYIKSVAAIEDAMEPYKEQKRDLRSEFKENGWLSPDEIRAAVKAFRLYKGEYNIDEVVDNFNMITGKTEQ